MYCMHVFQIGQLYGQFEGSGNIMRHLTISDDISGAYFSMPTKGVFRRYFIFHNLSLSAHRRRHPLVDIAIPTRTPHARRFSTR